MVGSKPAGSEMVLSLHSGTPIVYHESLGEILAQLHAPLILPNQELHLALSEVRTSTSFCAEGAKLISPFSLSLWETALALVPQLSTRLGDLGSPESRPTVPRFSPLHVHRSLRSVTRRREILQTVDAVSNKGHDQRLSVLATV